MPRAALEVIATAANGKLMFTPGLNDPAALRRQSSMKKNSRGVDGLTLLNK